MARTTIKARSPYREQARLILIGALIPLLVNVAYLAKLFGWSNTADLTPIALAVSSLVFSHAVRRHQMLTLSPIARQVVLDSMIDGLLVVDPAGRIVEHNPAAATIVQLAPSAVGSLLAEASHNRMLGGALHNLFSSSTANEQIVAIPDPEPRYIQATRTPLSDTAGRRLGTLLMLRDITRQTLAEEALARQAADLTTLHHVASAIGTTLEPRELLPAIVAKTREALGMSYAAVGLIDAAIANAQLFEASQQGVRTKSAILDTISHEFRTPITAILGFTELYQEQVLGAVTEEQHEALSAVHRNAHRLLKLVDDMLDLARLEAGKLDLALHPVEIELCIKDAVAIVETQSSGKPFQLQFDVSASLPFAQADTMWLRRALVHLFSYALSSSEERRISIHAHTAAQHDESVVGPQQLVIEIKDGGPELSEAEQSGMFEAFQQVPNSASELTISSISRMGLAISKRAIEQMSGQLSVDSQPGQGSTFTICLPAVELALEHVN